MIVHICNEGLSCVLTYAGPHQGTGEDVDKGEYGGQQRAINKEPSNLPFPALLALLHPLLPQVTPFHTWLVPGQ